MNRAAVRSYLISVCLIWASQVWAGLTPQQTDSIIAAAYGQCPQIQGQENGCPRELLKAPPIHVVPQAQICALMGKGPHCSYVGVFTPEPMTIYLADKLDFSTAYGASVLLHELIHYFQQVLKGDVHDCLSYLNREREAYQIQAKYLMKAGEYEASRMVMLSGQMLRCS